MNLIKVENGCLTQETLNAIIELEQKAKEIKTQQDEMKKALLKAMEDNGVIKFEGEDIKITYIDPTVRESFDSKKFREDRPDIYDEYVKFSKVNASIRITIK